MSEESHFAGLEAFGRGGMQPFNDRINELSVLDRCVLWGSRVVVPKVGCEKVLDELHKSHHGVSTIKGLGGWCGGQK